MSQESWNTHYRRDKSALAYPDENLVRMIRRDIGRLSSPAGMTAADIGCGSGRHVAFLHESGIEKVFGLDISYNALEMTKKNFGAALIQADTMRLPLRNESVDIAVAWGSLHYNLKKDLPVMLSEIRRVLKYGGRLYTTLRSSRDSYLRTGTHTGNDEWITDLPDLAGARVSFYSEDELREAFILFGNFEFGIVERSPVGDTGRILSHWVIRAAK